MLAEASLYVLAQAAEDGSGLGVGDIAQTGVTGVALTALAVFAKTTHARYVTRVEELEKKLDDIVQTAAARDREAARADAAEARAERLERKLDDLNRTMFERVAPVLTEAGRALADATLAIRGRP